MLGIALVVAGSLAALLLTSSAGQRRPVLVLARDVPVGQSLTAGDLRVEQVAVDATVATVPADQASSLVGRVATAPLRAGRLLAADDVGAAAWPPPGQVLAAVAIGPGAAPPELAAGMHVLVGTGTTDTAIAASPASPAGAAAGFGRDGLWGAPEAVVASVRDNPTGTGGRIVSLLLSRSGAGAVTAIPATQLRLVVVPVAPPTEPPTEPPTGPSTSPSAG